MSLALIQESFYSREFRLDAVSGWLFSVIAIAIVLVAVILIRNRLSRRVKYSPHGTVNDPRMIRNILRTAFDQRRPFEVQVHTGNDQRRPSLRCAPEYLGNDRLTLEVGGIKTLSDRWLGHAIVVFFRIHVGRDFTYYTFNSKIGGISIPKPGICNISLAIPEALDNRQKRSFLRIAPPREFFLGAAIWKGLSMPDQTKLAEICEWPRPELLYIPDKLDQFRVIDLSAGGARVGIPGKLVRSMNMHFSAAEQLLLMLDLFDPETNKRLRYWMLCRVQSVWVEHTSQEVHAGMQFMAWARPMDQNEKEENKGRIEWLRLSSSHEVEPIGNWVMRRHLELFRDTPAEY